MLGIYQKKVSQRDFECLRKKRYESRQEAEQSRDTRHGVNLREQHAYKCRFGDHWHLGRVTAKK